MRHFLRRAIPSMFHRRLILLACVAIIVTTTLSLAAAGLTTGSTHREALKDAKDRLKVSRLTTTIRGRILDRYGRVLAVDEPGWEVAAHYALINGTWAKDEARMAAYRANKDRWGGLSAAEKDALTQQQRQELELQQEMVWTLLSELGGLAREQVERKKTDVISRVQYLQNHLWARWEQQMEQELGEDVPLSAVVRPIAEEKEYHAVLDDINDEVRQIVQGFIAEAQRNDEAAEAMRVWRMVELRRPTVRRYPLETMTVMVDRSTLPPVIADEAEQEITVEGVGMHILGQMRSVQAEDVTGEHARPLRRRNDAGQWVVDLGGYLPHDQVGSFGVESVMEHRLRGLRGREVRHLDDDTIERYSAKQGKDVNLTIDIQLQARIQAIMSPEFGLMVTNPWHNTKLAEAGKFGTPLNGAAVVMDVETGEVLAAVSNPPMPLRLLQDDPDKVYRDPWNLPYLNRTVASRYPPGSTLKPLVLISAASAGLHNVDTPIVCDGIFDRDHPTRHRCWIFKQYMMHHGPLGAADALKVSCNIYFYTLGQRLGVSRLDDWLGKFGLGQVTNCGLDGEVEGDVPDPRTTDAGEAINMGIGQGPVGWTPMQAAAAYVAIARNGEYLTPTVIADADRLEPRRPRDLKLNRRAINAVFDGLHGVVYDAQDGGAHHLPVEATPDGQSKPPIFNLDGVTIYGKTGTAQTGTMRVVDENMDGTITPNERHPDPESNGWFVAMVQPKWADRPTHVVVVLTEFGGSGGRASAPIVNQIVHALKTEGYLDPK